MAKINLQDSQVKSFYPKPGEEKLPSWVRVGEVIFVIAYALFVCFYLK